MFGDDIYEKYGDINGADDDNDGAKGKNKPAKKSALLQNMEKME